MSTSESQSTKQNKPRKLRSACDACHRSKTRCSGGTPCTRCREFLTPCSYSYSVRCGKPKGSRCRKTLEREQRAADAAEGRLHSAPAPGEQIISPPNQLDYESGPTVAPSATSSSREPSPCFSDALRSLSNGAPESPVLDLAPTEQSNEIGTAGSLSLSELEAEDPASFQFDWTLPESSIAALEAISLSSSTDSDLAKHLNLPSWLQDHASTMDEEAPLPLPQYGSCKCLSTLTAIASREMTAPTVRQYDATLVFVRNFSHACCAFYQCPYCPKDAGSISLTVTTLQLVTSAIENTMRHLCTIACGFEDCLGLPHGFQANTGAQLHLPFASLSPSTGAAIPFQLGMYQALGEDDDEQSQIVGVLIRSGVRRLLRVCWPIWDLLRTVPGSPKTQSSEPHIQNPLNLSLAEVSQLRRTLVQSQNRLCGLLS